MARARKRPRPPTRTLRPPAAPSPSVAVPSFDARAYEEFFENANDAIAIFALDGTILLVNGGAEILLQRPRAEIIGHHFREFATPESVALADQRTAEFLAGRKPASSVFEITIMRKDGTPVPVEARTRVMTDANGKPFRFQGSYRDVTARKERETRYRRINELISDYAFALHLDAQHNIVVDWLTDNFAAVAGFPVEHLRGQPNAILAYIHADDHETVRRALTALQPDECTTYEFRMVRPNAAERRMRSTVHALTNEAGGITIEGASRDITAVWESEERFRELVALAPDVIYQLSLDGRFDLLNSAFEEYTPWKIGEWQHKDFLDLIHDGDKALAGELFQKLLQKESVPPFRLRIKTKTEDYRIAECHAKPLLKNDTVVSILGIARDITERVQAEEALHETRRMHAMVADTVPDVIGVYDIPQDRIVYLNTHVVEILGVLPHDLLGQGLAALQHWLPEEDRPWIGQRYQQLLEGGMVEVEHGVLHRNGERRWLSSRAVVCHKTREGKPDQILVVGQDITTRKRLEQLMQSQVMAMEELPERLRKFRERLGMTQTEFGREFASRNGPYNNRQMSSYETGDTIVPLELLLAIRAKGFATEGVLGVGPTDVGEKTVSYFSTKRAEQAVIVELLTALLRVATRDRETMESTLQELRIPGRELSSGERRLLQDAQSLGIAEERTRE